MPPKKKASSSAAAAGSPMYQDDLKKDAMAVVCRFGPPTYFITFTANPN
jgi:hypothetical protein